MANNTIRTRFAPSPTGYMHVGNLRTALYAYLIAKHENGDFILRIEDTDQERYVEGAIAIIYKTLELTGLNHDEGPDIGGPVGPYIQSERRNLYLDYAKQLIQQGDAYYCFCTKERLDILRTNSESIKAPFKYDKHCLNLTKEEVNDSIAKGENYVIRQNNPTSGITTFDDVIYGTVSVDNTELEDMILIKSDGLPTYNFANVVDDHLMGITHIVRGSEYLSSSPKYNRLYEAFHWEIPVYVHCPPIMKDAHQKLSKRNGDASFEDLISKGYLKNAILNYIALLGWHPGNTEEIFSLQDLVKIFDYRHINKAPAIFDLAKLKWMNGEYIRMLPLEELHAILIPFYKEGIKNKNLDLLKITCQLQTRIEVLNDVTDNIDFFDNLPDYSIDIYVNKKMKTTLENSLRNLQEALPVLSALETWTLDSLQKAMMGLIVKLGVKNGVMLWPLRIAISGKQSTPGGAYEIAEILGKEESLNRINFGIEKLSASTVIA